MGADCVYSIIGKKPFDLVIKNVKIVNVFTESIVEGDVAVTGGVIAYIGPIDFPYTANEEIDGAGRYAVPGFIDAHMHIESSMMAPARFAELVLACGTTTVAADPHEIANVCGAAGVRAMAEASANMPLHVLMMAPSTIPSAPGLERSGWSLGEKEMEELLDIPGVAGMGELMDFNAVAGGDERILGVVEAARRRGVILDGHVPALTGARLQAFRATGVDADHTDMSLPRAKEKLAAGFSIQIQHSFLSEDLIAYVDQFPLQDRIMLITDDVPFVELVEHGHLNANVRRAIALGLRPLRAIRYATINAAARLRLYDRGAVSPGYRADILLMKDLEKIEPDMVFSDGRLVAENGRCLVRMEKYKFPEEFYHSDRSGPCPAPGGGGFCAEGGAPGGSGGGADPRAGLQRDHNPHEKRDALDPRPKRTAGHRRAGEGGRHLPPRLRPGKSPREGGLPGPAGRVPGVPGGSGYYLRPRQPQPHGLRNR